MDKFLTHLLGALDGWDYLAGFVFALIGAVVSLRHHAKSRNKKSIQTPSAFSWRFMLLDNLQRLFVGFLVTFLCFRFSGVLNQEFSMLYAVAVGAGSDRFAGLFDKAEKLARGK